ncbi:hypothetical protein ACVRZD_07725 [Streptococcus hongkongensis]|nr:hypothetical protein NC01_07725 [Streptococcus uberis]
MTDLEIQELQERFFKTGYLVGRVSQRDILFKYTVPIDVERKESLTVSHAHNPLLKMAVLNPSGVAYTYQFIDGIEDNITEITYDGTLDNLYDRICHHLGTQ